MATSTRHLTLFPLLIFWMGFPNCSELDVSCAISVAVAAPAVSQSLSVTVTDPGVAGRGNVTVRIYGRRVAASAGRIGDANKVISDLRAIESAFWRWGKATRATRWWLDGSLGGKPSIHSLVSDKKGLGQFLRVAPAPPASISGVYRYDNDGDRFDEGVTPVTNGVNLFVTGVPAVLLAAIDAEVDGGDGCDAGRITCNGDMLLYKFSNDGAAMASRPVSPSQSFTIVALPDTQFYAKVQFAGVDLLPLFKAQADWIRKHVFDRNIAFVSHLGDIVDNFDIEEEWVRASSVLQVLDGIVPYGLVVGNHDMAAVAPSKPSFPDGSAVAGEAVYFNKYFPPSRYQDYGWWGGSYQTGATRIPSAYDASGRPVSYIRNTANAENVGSKNSFQLFSAGGNSYIFMNLEFSAPDGALAWADRQFKSFSKRHAILATHAFITTNAVYQKGVKMWDAASRNWVPDGHGEQQVKLQNGRPVMAGAVPVYQNGDVMWAKLVEPNANLNLVVNGHFGFDRTIEATANRRADAIPQTTRIVQQLAVDYQSFLDPDLAKNRLYNGGSGYMRLMTFVPDESIVQVQTYSPAKDPTDSQYCLLGGRARPADQSVEACLTDPLNQFTIDYDMTGSKTWSKLHVSPPTPGGSAVRFVWKNLAPGTTYEWFYTVIGSDGISKKVGPTATFSTPP